MLPILRTITVGGVLLAFTIFVLALSPPDGSRTHLARIDAPARGPLIDRDTHPEWRQLLLLAAFRRAAQLKGLRELPDTPVRPSPQPVPAAVTDTKPAEQIAALQQHDRAGSIAPHAAATIPIGIGEASSTELPVTPREERPPVITTPLLLEGDQPEPPTSPVPTPSQTRRQDQGDMPPVSTGDLRPLKIIVPVQPAPAPATRQAMREDKADKPPVSVSDLKPLKVIVPIRPAPEPATRQALRENKPDKPPAVASTPRPVRAKPDATTRAKPPKRPRRAARHHARPAKPAKASVPPPFDFFALLAASFKANAEHGPPNPIIKGHK